MLRSTKQLYGDPLGTDEGEIGHVKDFYFDDRDWVVRYVVVDTGTWLPGRLVLLSPHAFGNFYQDGKSLRVSLTRKQIEESPPIAWHKPISRQYEEEYYRYYGWPSYWDGGGMWGGDGFPLVPPPHPGPTEAERRDQRAAEPEDARLRSTKAVTGYRIQTSDGPIGHVADFMMDDRSWALRQIVVETGRLWAGKEVALTPSRVSRISYEDSRIFVDVTRESLQQAPEYQRPHPVYHDTRDFDD